MEIYQLRTFLTVARCGHLTRASEQLHLSQPAVSKQIRSLEDELGVSLFERTPFGVVLSQAGKLLLPYAEKTFSDASELVTAAQHLKGKVAGTVRIGTIIDPESLKLGEFLTSMVDAHPLIEIKLVHGISGRILDMVGAGELDAGFYLGPCNDPGIVALELRKVAYVVVAPVQWAERIRDADWPALASLPWVGTPEHSSQYRIQASLFEGRGLKQNTVIEADQESSMISLVKTGVGLCLMREELASPAAARCEVVIVEGAPIPCLLSFLYSETRSTDPLIEAMVAVLKATHGLVEPATAGA